MNWITATHVNVQEYNSGTGTWSNGTSNASYMNLRFPSFPIKTENDTINRIFVGYTGSDPVYDKIGDIQKGDIVIFNDTEAYMYVNGTDVAAGAPIVNASSGFFYCSGGGGWVPADTYWTRSPYNNHGTWGAFMYVNAKGTLRLNAEADSSYTGYGFNYSFSI